MQDNFPLSQREIANFDLERVLKNPTRSDETIDRQYREHHGTGHGYGRPIAPALLGLDSTRDLSVVGGATAGANLVGSDTTASGPSRRLWPLERAGATILNDLRSDWRLTTFDTGSVEVSPVAETSESSEVNPTLHRLDLRPEMLTGFVDSTPRLDMLTDVRTTLTADAGAAVWRGLHAQAFANLAADTAIASCSLEDAGWSAVNDAVAALASTGVETDKASWLLHPTDRALLSKRARVAPGDVCLIENGLLAGVRVIECAQVPAGSAFLGDFAELIIGLWGIEVLLDDVTLRTSGRTRYHIFAFANSGARRPSAFLKCSDLS